MSLCGSVHVDLIIAPSYSVSISILATGGLLMSDIRSNKVFGAPLLLVCAAVLWSIGGLLIKLVDSNPLAIAGARSAIAAATLMLVLRKPKFTWSFDQIAAALSYAGMVTMFVTANKTTTAANAIMLQFTAPIYVALLGSWFLKERVKLSDWIMIFLVMGGMALFFIGGLNTGGMLGNLIAAGSGVCFALFTIFMRRQKDGSPIESVFLGNILTALIGLPFFAFGTPEGEGWLYLLVLGVFQLGVSYILYSKAIKKATALEAVLIPVVEPILNPVWVFLLLGEVPGPYSIVGGLIVLSVITVRCILATASEKSSLNNEMSI
jgi:drug/metabolite transporter (DMT)-like permease